jgi:1-acyl-sn-glycerol-3-phosphate acyltransferase
MTDSSAKPLPPSGPLNRAWRIFATGLSFSVFGLAGLIGSITLYPAVGLSTRDPNVRRRRAQRITQLFFRFFSHFMQFVGVIRFEVHGAEKLRQPGVMIIANHPSLIDVVLLIAQIPAVDCIVKRAVFENPFMKWPVIWSGYICHDTPEQLIADCTTALANGRSLMIFPESTRSVPGQPIRMMHGAARIAVETGATVLPVTITCTPPMLMKGVPWYRVPPRPGHFTLTVDEPRPVPRSDPRTSNASLAARRLTHEWERYFASRTGVRAAHPLAVEPPGQQYSP